MELQFNPGKTVLAFLPIRFDDYFHPGTVLFKVQIISRDYFSGNFQYICKKIEVKTPDIEKLYKNNTIYKILQKDIRPITSHTLVLKQLIDDIWRNLKTDIININIGESYLLFSGFNIYSVYLIERIDNKFVIVIYDNDIVMKKVPIECLFYKSLINVTFMTMFNKWIHQFPPLYRKEDMNAFYLKRKRLTLKEPLRKNIRAPPPYPSHLNNGNIIKKTNNLPVGRSKIKNNQIFNLIKNKNTSNIQNRINESKNIDRNNQSTDKIIKTKPKEKISMTKTRKSYDTKIVKKKDEFNYQESNTNKIYNLRKRKSKSPSKGIKSKRDKITSTIMVLRSSKKKSEIKKVDESKIRKKRKSSSKQKEIFINSKKDKIDNPIKEIHKLNDSNWEITPPSPKEKIRNYSINTQKIPSRSINLNKINHLRTKRNFSQNKRRLGMKYQINNCPPPPPPIGEEDKLKNKKPTSLSLLYKMVAENRKLKKKIH